MSALGELTRFQTDRDLDKKEFNVLNESANIVEELLELASYDVAKENRPALKEAWSAFVTSVEASGIAVPVPSTESTIPDSLSDIITFCDGGLLKAGYDPEKAIAECGKEINSRVGSMVDGKFEKDLSPEAQANWYIANYSLAKKD